MAYGSNEAFWHKLIMVFLGGISILIGVIMINTEQKIVAAFLMILGLIILFNGLKKMD